jgi:2Fe-2S ferredoxin
MTITNREGVTATINAAAGHCVKDVLRDNGFDEVLALCGGSCSCGTCHVYVDDAFGALLPPLGENEDGLLSTLRHRTAASRLSCQIPFTEALDGLKITITPED